MIKSGMLGKAAAGLVAAALTVGGGSAVAMAATGHNPGEVAHGAGQIVEDCKDKVRMDDRDKGTQADTDAHTTSGMGSSHGIGRCVSAAVHKRNEERRQQETGESDTDKHKSASSNPMSGNGQGGDAGAIGAPGQRGTGTGTAATRAATATSRHLNPAADHKIPPCGRARGRQRSGPCSWNGYTVSLAGSS